MGAVTQMDERRGVVRLSSPADAADAVSELFMLHHSRLLGLATLLVGNRQVADDVVQDAFLGLYRHWSHLRDPRAAVGYLNKAVVNGGREHFRRGKRAALLLPRMAPRAEELASAEQDAVGHDEADRLRHAIDGLPWRQRQVLVLRYYLDQSEAEIADTLGIARGSVKRHASRGLATLACNIGGER